MNLRFEFKKDWSSGAVSFKKGQVADGDITETGNKAPYTINNPQYKVEFKDPKGGPKVQAPFCYQGETIVEPTVAPWLCNIGQIDLTPPPQPTGTTTKGGEVYQGPVQSIGARVFSLRNIIIALVIIVLIGLYLKYRKKKQ